MPPAACYEQLLLCSTCLVSHWITWLTVEFSNMTIKFGVQGSCLHWSPSTKINPAFNLNSVQKPCWVTIRSGFKNPVDWCWLMIRSGIILAFIHGGWYNTILYYDMGANYITQWYIVIYYDCDGNPFLNQAFSIFQNAPVTLRGPSVGHRPADFNVQVMSRL